MRKRYLIPIFACILLLSCCTVALAHPGDTDANGGHYDHSTGEYHYHHGYPVHQHTDGKCPYDFDDRTNWNSGSPGNSAGSDSTPAFLSDVWGSPLIIFYFICLTASVISGIMCLPFVDNYSKTHSRFNYRFGITPKYAAIIGVVAFANLVSVVGLSYVLFVSCGGLCLLVLATNCVFWGICAYLRYHPVRNHPGNAKKIAGWAISIASILYSCFTEFEFIFSILACCIFSYAAVKLPTEFLCVRRLRNQPKPKPKPTPPKPLPTPEVKSIPRPALQHKAENKPLKVAPELSSAPGPKPPIKIRPDPKPPSKLNPASTCPYYHDGQVITLYAVESSYISHVGYLPFRDQLFVRTKSGRVYTYNNIRPELYLEFIHADSVGEFYNQRIKRNHKQ
ncbi:MAG: KTSC domain-containing protein [Oscillospiraceae bacterium]